MSYTPEKANIDGVDETDSIDEIEVFDEIGTLDLHDVPGHVFVVGVSCLLPIPTFSIPSFCSSSLHRAMASTDESRSERMSRINSEKRKAKFAQAEAALAPEQRLAARTDFDDQTLKQLTVATLVTHKNMYTWFVEFATDEHLQYDTDPTLELIAPYRAY